MKLDLNCDLGEGEPLSRTRALMRWITSANVACGGHAGTVATMTMCVRLARRHGVRLGAHPGSWARDDFGRGAVALSPDDLELLLLHQVGALEQIARAEGMRLQHIKLHGALYHATEQDDALARRYLRVVGRWWPSCLVFARAAGRVARLAGRFRIAVWEEAFADRGYRNDGSLIARGERGALIENDEQVVARTRLLMNDGTLEAASGRRLALRPRTICVHADTAGAQRLVRLVALELKRGGTR